MKHRSRVFVSLTMLFIVEAFSGHAAFGQGGANASISGIVQDQTQALIPGVTVTLMNVATGVMASTITNESGAYAFPSITPGNVSPCIIGDLLSCFALIDGSSPLRPDGLHTLE